MKKNGFTFVEVLGVVTLLALLSVIVLFVVDKNLKDSKTTLSQVQIQNIKSAASMWRTDHIEQIPSGGYYTITFGSLVENGYISDLTDFNTNQNFNHNISIDVYLDNIVVHY